MIDVIAACLQPDSGSRPTAFALVQAANEQLQAAALAESARALG